MNPKPTTHCREEVSIPDNVKLDISSIPPYVAQNLARQILACFKAFIADPENKAWLEAKTAERLAAEAAKGRS